MHIAGVMIQHISLLSPIKHTNTRQSRQGLGQYLPIIAHTPPKYKRAKPHYFLLCHSPTNYLFTTDFYFRFLSTFTPTFTPDFYFHFLFTSASYLPPLFIPTFYPLFTSAFYPLLPPLFASTFTPLFTPLSSCLLPNKKPGKNP